MRRRDSPQSRIHRRRLARRKSNDQAGEEVMPKGPLMIPQIAKPFDDAIATPSAIVLASFYVAALRWRSVGLRIQVKQPEQGLTALHQWPAQYEHSLPLKVGESTLFAIKMEKPFKVVLYSVLHIMRRSFEREHWRWAYV